MARDPDDLVIRILREIQGTLSEHTQRFDRTDESLAQIERRMTDFTTAVMPGLEPGIQGPHARSSWPWIAGSGPAMTGVDEAPEG